jgi:hypothetical protein
MRENGRVPELVIDPRYRGPEDSANGGYACGRIAALAGGEVEVTLRAPPPLGVALAVAGGRVAAAGTLVAAAGISRDAGLVFAVPCGSCWTGRP